ncbi:anillin-like protein 1 [Coccinella septempunctata]|uniref:anillin-like protein 1 n=1 Tax=Coccinella septempunctata TaxID=41139 RepID=UPI001D06BE9A|nr:anillin-like protein 1 [Coccinella septempunctata]
MRSKTGKKFGNGINDVIVEEENDEITDHESMKAVFQLSINKDNDEIDRILDQQDAIISQANKALGICQDEEKYKGSKIRIEVERILLKANATKEIIENHKIKYSYQDPEDRSGFIKISNLRVFLRNSNKPKTVESQYVCILYCGATIYCSTLTYFKKKRRLELPESYTFNELPSDFKIGCQIYVIQSDAVRKHSFYNLIKSCGLLLKSLFICSNPPSETECRTRTGFEKCGEFLITRNVSKPKEFLFEDRSQCDQITEKFLCDIESGVNLKYEMFGYLLICKVENDAGWVKQWCELDGAELKFWNTSGSEDEPKMTIDLSRSLFRRIPYADSAVYCREKSLHVRIKPEFPADGAIHEDVFLSSDDQEVLVNWKVKLNIVLFNLQNWGCMKI